MARLTSELLRPVDTAHALDEAALLRYAAANVPGFPGPAPALALTQFGHGQSNPTYCIQASAPGGATRRYVVRKKPPGAILQSAHAVEREYQVLKALGDHTDVPVPKVYCLCTDSSVIGTPFYIMEYLEGIIYPDNSLPGVTPSKRRAIYLSTAKTLAAIHKVDVNDIGLQKYGRRDNYCKRQVDRWERQYLASTGEGKPTRYQRMLDLARWLKEHVPKEDASAGSGTGLVHGDYRPDNLVFHPTEDRVIGVIDWELSTLGNQMCDVAYSCLDLRSGAVIGTGHRRKGAPSLYIMDTLRRPPSAVSPPHVSSAASISASSFAQWHHRLGHLCGSRLSTLIKSGCLGRTSVEPSFHCKGCKLGKQVQLPYPSSVSHSTRPFDLSF